MRLGLGERFGKETRLGEMAGGDGRGLSLGVAEARICDVSKLGGNGGRERAGDVATDSAAAFAEDVKDFMDSLYAAT